MIPKENGADYDDLMALVARCDENLGIEERAQPSGPMSEAWSFDNAGSDNRVAACGVTDSGNSTAVRGTRGQAQREFMKVAAALEKVTDLDDGEIGEMTESFPAMPTKRATENRETAAQAKD